MQDLNKCQYFIYNKKNEEINIIKPFKYSIYLIHIPPCLTSENYVLPRGFSSDVSVMFKPSSIVKFPFLLEYQYVLCEVLWFINCYLDELTIFLIHDLKEIRFYRLQYHFYLWSISLKRFGLKALVGYINALHSL